MTGTRPSHFDELIEELFAAFDDNWFHSPRRWWPRNGRSDVSSIRPASESV